MHSVCYQQKKRLRLQTSQSATMPSDNGLVMAKWSNIAIFNMNSLTMVLVWALILLHTEDFDCNLLPITNPKYSLL